MSVAVLSILLAGLMPYVFVAVAKFTGRRYNNHAPREFLASLQGFRARANWAHQNAFEAFPLFAAAVIIAMLRQVDAGTLDTLALSFVGLRLLYFVCYLADWPLLRSAVWALAIACPVALLILSL